MTKYVTPVLVLVVAVLAVALFVRGGEVMTAFAISATNTSAATHNITNAAPTCEAFICKDGSGGESTIDLVGGTTKRVYCTGICNDPNNWGNIINYTGQMNKGGSGDCSADYNNCYLNATCQNKTSVNTTAMNIECNYDFWFHADNTSETGDWTGRLKAGDVGGLVVTSTDTIDVSALLALGVDPTLAFGAKTAATNDSTITHGHTLFNYGNIQIDFQVNGTDMACDVSTIPAEYLKVNLTNTDDYQAAYPLTGTLGNSAYLRTFNLAKSTDASGNPVATEKETYWGVGVPSGVGGNCQGTIWFAAIAS